MGWFKVKQQAFRLDMIIGCPAVLAGRYSSAKPKYFRAAANEPSTSTIQLKTRLPTFVSRCANLPIKVVWWRFTCISHIIPPCLSKSSYDSTCSACRSPPARPTLGHAPVWKTYPTELEVRLWVLRRFSVTCSLPWPPDLTPGSTEKVQSYCRQTYALVMI